MTSLFLEYEKLREREEFNKSFIGKKFYWNSQSGFRRMNLFTIVECIAEYYPFDAPIVTYTYDYGGSHKNRERLEHILSHTTEYDPANFPAGHLD
jgi:hypothetical protein